MNRLVVALFLVVIFVVNVNLTKRTTVEKWERPRIVYPDDNPLTDASIELGGTLFFETLLSRDTTISCQSCHMRTDAFADHLPKGEGILGRHVERNTPTLFNIGFHPYFMMDGKFSTLEEQVLAPIKEHREFDMTPELVIEKIIKNCPITEKCL